MTFLPALKLVTTESGHASRSVAATRRFCTLATIMLVLAGCSSFKPTQQAMEPQDYTKRHPIILKHGVEYLDIFNSGNQLNQRQYLDVVAFGKDYAENGNGTITVALSSAMTIQNQQQLVVSIQRALAEAGAPQKFEITSYAPNSKSQVASPVRLSFVKLNARLTEQCGQWPTDLGGGDNLESWHNQPYHNLGCSTQSMIAAQVANPEDIVRPRGEGPTDVVQRVKALQALRSGSGTDKSGSSTEK